MMNEQRWLLPFTHGVDVSTITTVVRLAASCGATLVAVSLIAIPEGDKPRGVRLEHLQQSKDFFEVVRHLAVRFQVTLERHEIWTRTVGSRIAEGLATLTRDYRCDCCVVVAKEQQAVLLHTDELAHLLTGSSPSLFLLRLPAGQPRPRGSGFVAWFWRTFGRKEKKMVGCRGLQKGETVPCSGQVSGDHPHGNTSGRSKSYA
jgi:hypothetical protein